MKLLISICLALMCGCLVWVLLLSLQSKRRPTGDFLTLALKKWIQNYVMPCRIPWLARYLDHVFPLLEEVGPASKMDVPLLLGTQLLTGILIGGTAAYFFPAGAWLVFPFAFGAGSTAPYFWLLLQRSQLHNYLLKAMPEWLELTALVMEAGLDFNAGLQQYLQKGAPGPLQALLVGFQKETQMGRSRLEALSGLARKTSFAPLRDVCRSLVQALSLGGSLAPLLREQASALRTKRMQMAEKKAAEAPLKVLFPLFVFIVPTVFIVLFGPVAMMFVKGGF